MNYYDKNLETLKVRFGISFNSKALDTSNYIIEEGRDGRKSVKIHKENKWLYLGSKYNQQKDLELFVNKVVTDDIEKYIIVVGFGLGYHIRELLNSIGDNSVLILENDSELLKIACSVEDLSDILTDKRIYIALYESEDHLNEIFKQYITVGYINSIVTESYHNYSLIYGDKVKLAYEVLKKFQVMAVMNSNTAIEVSYKYIQNFFLNLPYMINGHSVTEMKDAFEGKTAVIVSSGPSLSKNMSFLEGYQNKAVIITGGRNLSGLIKKGIRPHFACAGDAGTIMHELMKESYKEGVPFVLTEQVCSDIPQKNMGLNIFDSIIFKESSRAFTGKRYAGLNVAGTVATLCISLAVYMGCSKIILIGQDLAYTNNQYHAQEAAIVDGVGNTVINTDDMFYVAGNEEEKVLTDQCLNTFRLWIEDFIKANSGVEFINCTEGGAFIRGTKVQKLKDTLIVNCVEEINAESIIKDKFKNENKLHFDSIHKLLEFKGTLENIKIRSKKAYEYSSDIFDYYNENKKANIDGILKELDSINNYIKDKYEFKEFLNYISYPFLDEFMRNPKLRESKDDTQKELGKKLAMRNQLLFGGIYESIDNVIKLVNISIERLEENNKDE